MESNSRFRSSQDPNPDLNAATIPAKTCTNPYFQLQSPLPFTVTKPVTIQEMSIALSLVTQTSCLGRSDREYDVSIHVPRLQMSLVIDLILPRKRLGNG